jgi:hypothetical protein
MAADLMSEIEALRSQIDALTKQMPKGAESSRPADAPTGSVSGTHSGPLGLDSETIDKIKEQFEGFVELLEKQLHDVPAGTAIAIFALGVLLGRLLPR